MNKRFKKNSLIVAVIAGMGLLIFQTSQSSTKEDVQTAKSAVKTITPMAYTEKNYVTLPATAIPIKQVNIYPRADGFIEKRLVDIGQDVKKGQLLAKISSPELEERLNQAKADITKQKAMVSLASKLKIRYEKLRTSGAISKNDLDESEANYATAKALLYNYQARLKQLEASHAYTSIVAPFNGVITERQAEVGDRVSMETQKVLFTIANQQQLKIIVPVSQDIFNQIDFKKDAEFYLSEKNGTPHIVKYARGADSFAKDTGTMRVEYIMENMLNLPSGMTGDAKLSLRVQNDLLSIPLNSIDMVNGQTAVMVLRDKKISKRIVKIVKFTKQKVIIGAGLKPDDKVIVNPNALLQNGDVI